MTQVKKNANALTLGEARRYHRELFGWLAEDGTRSASEWPGWAQFEHDGNYGSFACNYAGADPGEEPCFVAPPYCTNCPLYRPLLGARTYERPDCCGYVWDLPEDPAERQAKVARMRDARWSGPLGRLRTRLTVRADRRWIAERDAEEMKMPPIW
jgi:hypothetical protein